MAPKQARRPAFYDLKQVSRFLYSVAYAEKAAENTRLIEKSWTSGGNQVDTADVVSLRGWARSSADMKMFRFTELAHTGSTTSIQGFFEHQRYRYIAARREIDRVFNEFNQSQTTLQNRLSVAQDVAHIVHGAANAVFGIVSFILPGTGSVLGTGINMADSLISGETVVAVVSDEVSSHVEDELGKQSERTFKNIVDRQWKYAGALKNAEARYAVQRGAYGTLRAYNGILLYQTLKDQNIPEIQNALSGLLSPKVSASYSVSSVPDLAIPVPQ